MTLQKDLSDKILGMAFEVYGIYGPGLAESAYGTAMAIELDLPGISYERQKIYELTHKGYTG